MDWIADQPEKKIRKFSAYDAAIKLLCRKDYSRYKLSQKLLDKDYPLHEIEETVEKLVKQRYLREDYYIEARIKGFIRKNYSARYIQQKLAQEHLDVPIDKILHVFEGVDVTEQDQVKKLIEKKRLSIGESENDEFKIKEKIYRFLVGKGHFESFR